MIMKNRWVKEEIKRKIKNYLKTNGNGNAIYRSYDKPKAVLRGKFVAITVYIKRKRETQINFTL